MSPSVNHRRILCASGIYDQGATKKWFEKKARNGTLAVRKYAWDRIGDHEGAQLRCTIRMFKAVRLFNFTYMKLNLLDISDIEILKEVFPFVNADVVHNLKLEKADYNMAASMRMLGSTCELFGMTICWSFLFRTM